MIRYVGAFVIAMIGYVSLGPLNEPLGVSLETSGVGNTNQPTHAIARQRCQKLRSDITTWTNPSFEYDGYFNILLTTQCA